MSVKSYSVVFITLMCYAAAGEIGTLEDFQAVYRDGGGRNLVLLYVDYSSGGPEQKQLMVFCDETLDLEITGRFPPPGMDLPDVACGFSTRRP